MVVFMGKAVAFLKIVQRPLDSTTWQRPLCCTWADCEGMVNTSLEVAAFLDQIRERERERGILLLLLVDARQLLPPPKPKTSRRIFRENARDPNSFSVGQVSFSRPF